MEYAGPPALLGRANAQAESSIDLASGTTSPGPPPRPPPRPLRKTIATNLGHCSFHTTEPQFPIRPRFMLPSDSCPVPVRSDTLKVGVEECVELQLGLNFVFADGVTPATSFWWTIDKHRFERSNAKLTDDEERDDGARLGTCGWSRSSSFGRAPCSPSSCGRAVKSNTRIVVVLDLPKLPPNAVNDVTLARIGDTKSGANLFRRRCRISSDLHTV